jgi:hypothetical protein
MIAPMPYFAPDGEVDPSATIERTWRPVIDSADDRGQDAFFAEVWTG